LMMLHVHHAGPPRWIAFVPAVISIAVKEALYRWTAGVGRRVRSSAVVANAWHHRSDALSSVPAALAVVAGVIDPSWSFLDEVAAVLVALLILHAAWRIGWPALGQLIDTGVPEEDCRKIRATALAVDAVHDVHALRTRYIGSGIGVDLHVLVDGEMTVAAGHDVAGEVKHRLLADGPEVVDVVVHVEPYENG
jgi:cation diffusion facilitator family transporter